jgi:hypothetical protein
MRFWLSTLALSFTLACGSDKGITDTGDIGDGGDGIGDDGTDGSIDDTGSTGDDGSTGDAGSTGGDDGGTGGTGGDDGGTGGDTGTTGDDGGTGGTGGDTGGDGGGTDGGDGSEEVTPNDGQWFWDGDPISSSTKCAGGLATVEAMGLLSYGDGYKIADSTTTSFTFVFESLGIEAACALGGSIYDCAASGEQLLEMGGSTATLTFDGTVDGQFYGPDTMEGLFDLILDCTGDLCATAESVGLTFPCDVAIDFAAVHE